MPALNYAYFVNRPDRFFPMQNPICGLLVRKSCNGAGYEIVSGHRRKEAALWVGLERVPVIVK